MSGFVSLVGAGPGDPDLLTVKATRALAAADLVFYDALISTDMLELAPRAQKFSVGKRCGKPAIRQETIHALLIRAAKRGKRVVRLKGGDPFVFGRGGEEALALAAAGIAFEVIPGISNSIAAPALAGIPVTHRGVSSAFVVVSAHDEATFRPVLEGLTPGSVTVVALMGLGTRARVASLLVERGWPESTPAAVVLGAGSARAHTWRGTLAGLGAAQFPDSTSGLPGTLVIGNVVSLAAVIAPARDAGAAGLRAQGSR